MELEQTDFNLTEQIREIVGRVSKMTAVDGYTVVFGDTEDRFVRGDSRRISQVIYNLLGNALTYTGPDKTVRISQTAVGSRIQVSISDTGEGIPEADLPYIWDRYYRSRENHRRSVIGSGLGLNICRGILEKHGAQYGVRSEPGQGTTFWFRLPEAQPEE
jgi:signal transduction histidine kinase